MLTYSALKSNHSRVLPREQFRGKQRRLEIAVRLQAQRLSSPGIFEKRRILQRGHSIWVISLWSNICFRTYIIRAPGPYAPDTGQAQITCKALLEAFALCDDMDGSFVPSRRTKEPSTGAEVSAGMTLNLNQIANATAVGLWSGKLDKIHV